HIRLEPRNHGLNREHDPVPGDLDYVPQPFSARSNTIPNGLHNRPQNVTEPITNRSHINLNSRPRRVNTITEPAHLLVHENKPSNKQGDGSNNQTNRVGLHRRVQNAHLYRSTRRGKLLSHQQRSEEHTSELQSRFELVCRLLLEKKNRTSMGRDGTK